MKKSKFLIIVLIVGLFSCQSPQKETDKNQSTAITATVLDSVIHQYITEKTKNDQAQYHFQNDSTTPRLKLLKVGTKRLKIKGDSSRYVIGAEMLNEDSDLYNMDFFLEDTAGKLNVVETKLQKRNSQARYVWAQDTDGAWYTVNEKNAPDRLMNVLKDTDNYTFTYKVSLPKHTDSAKVWVPVAQSSPFQDVQIVDIQAPKGYKIITDSKFGNKALYVRLKPSDKKQEISIKYKAKHWQKKPYEEKDDNPQEYLKATPLLPLNGQFAEIDNKIFKEKNTSTDMEKARAIYDYIRNNMRYNKITKYGTGSAVYACDMGTGNCTEFHSLFISLCRTANIPARYFIGASIPSTKDQGIVGYHCWAEFYANGKWIPIDISEAFKYSALIDYYFGHNPANRFLISRGRDISFRPAPKSGPIDFFIYPVMEINGQKVNAESSFSFKRIQPVS